jgi:ribosomal protein S17
MVMKAKIVKKIDKNTYSVSWTCIIKDSKYGKFIKVKKNRLVHNSNSKDFSCGDSVKIKQCSPVSKQKKWLIVSAL